MKIIYIITRLDFGGSSENVIELLGEFYKEGYDVVLIYGGNSVKDFSFKTYHLRNLKRNITLIDDIKAFFEILKIIKKEKPDIVHTHTSKAGFIGRWACFLYNLIYFKKTKIIHSPRGHVFYGYFDKIKSYLFVLIEKLTALIKNKLIALTENEKKESIEFGIGDEKKWIVIPSGVNYNIKVSNNLINEFSITQDTIIVGSVGRLDKVKGMEYFVSSLIYLKDIMKNKKLDKKVIYIIVGDGSEFNYLKNIVKNNGFENEIKFTGYRKDVIDIINIMDIYVQPSLNEGMGRTVVMAELLSKPVIASNVCGLKELVVDGYNGFLVEPKNPFRIAEKIYKLIENEEIRIKMGKNSFDFINKEKDGFKKYSFERCFYLHKKLYSS